MYVYDKSIKIIILLSFLIFLVFVITRYITITLNQDCTVTKCQEITVNGDTCYKTYFKDGRVIVIYAYGYPKPKVGEWNDVPYLHYYK